MRQACSQACSSRVARLSSRNHEVQNLRAHFILHIITIKWLMCVQEKIELSSMSQRPRLSSSKVSGDLSFAAKIKQHQKLQKNSQGWQEADMVLH